MRKLLPDTNIARPTVAGIRIPCRPADADIKASRDPFGDLGATGQRPADGVRHALHLAYAAHVLGVAGQDLPLIFSFAVQAVDRGGSYAELLVQISLARRPITIKLSSSSPHTA
jgi:hypothetical protein